MMKKLLATLSLLTLAAALTACTSNPAKVEASNAQFAEQVETQAEGTGDLTKSYTNIGN